ncbi:MAG: hypothetical protein ACFFBD_04985 [Candidatus Hodarchaeota archaeon]
MNLKRQLILGCGALFLILCLCYSHGGSATNSFLMSYWATDESVSTPPTLQDFQDCATLDAVDEATGTRGIRLYVKNNADDLWLAFRLKWAYSAQEVADSTATLSIDGDHDGFWAEDCKIIQGSSLSDSYFLRGYSLPFPDVSTDPDFYGSWTEVDARSEQGAANEQLIYFKIPLTSDEYLYDINIPNINNAFIGIGLRLSNENLNETWRFFGQRDRGADSADYLTLSFASAGDVPSPDYGSGEGPPTTGTSTETQSTYTYTGQYAPSAATGLELPVVLFSFVLMCLITIFYRRSRRNQ